MASYEIISEHTEWQPANVRPKFIEAKLDRTSE